MRTPSWTWGLNAGIIFVVVVAAIKIARNVHDRGVSKAPVINYASDLANRWKNAMKEPGSTESGGEDGATSGRSLVGEYVTSPTVGLMGAPSPNYPVCGVCGGDSRYCRHSAVGSAFLQGQSGPARINAASVASTFDVQLDRYFGRPRR